MADLDLSEIFSDPDLCDTFDVIRRSDAVDSHGRSNITEQTTSNIVGVVVPGDAGDLLRGDDKSTTSRMITVSTMYRLRASGDGFQPDVIFYDGIRFTVKAVKVWTRLGAGFVKAVATSGNAADPAPV